MVCQKRHIASRRVSWTTNYYFRRAICFSRQFACLPKSLPYAWMSSDNPLKWFICMNHTDYPRISSVPHLRQPWCLACELENWSLQIVHQTDNRSPGDNVNYIGANVHIYVCLCMNICRLSEFHTVRRRNSLVGEFESKK